MHLAVSLCVIRGEVYFFSLTATCQGYYFDFFSARALMTRLEEQLGPASETIRTIHSEMERDYYSADPRLVDPLLARCNTHVMTL